MGVIAEGIVRGCQGLFTPVSLRYPLSVFNKNSTLKERKKLLKSIPAQRRINEISRQKSFIQMEMSNPRISCAVNGERRSSGRVL